MQSIIQKISKQLRLASLFAMLAAVAIAAPQQASAVTSGDATIHNAVTVSYSAGAAGFTATANVNVTVTTIGAVPTITVSADQTGLAGAAITYTYTVRSNTNGPDTYTPGAVAHTDTNVGATASGVLGAAFDLWAGHVLSAGVGTITVPAAAVTGLVANTSTIELLVHNGTGFVQQRYTVTGIAAGAIATTDNVTDVTTAEVNAVLTLAPIGLADAIVAGTALLAGEVALGTQAGEYNTFTNVLTPGAPTTQGTDGSIVTNLDIVTTAGPTTTAAPIVTTTVSSPDLTIVKASRNLTNVGAFVTDGSTTALPGDVLEYQITVTNAHATASATNVSIADAIPAYTTLVTAAYNAADAVSITETIAGVAQATTFATSAVDADVAELATGTLTVNIGAGAADVAIANNGGTILGSALVESVVILYQVTVD